MDKVKILDKRIIENYIAYYPTLELLDNDTGEIHPVYGELCNPKPYTKIVSGITYRFFPKAFIDSKRISNEYMVFQISAKMLKRKYFDGLTIDNISSIVKDINEFKVIQISEFDFLDGLVSDIDLCLNEMIDLKSLKSAFSLIRYGALSGKKPLINFFNESFNIKSKNIGVEFNKREKATNFSPYCKIYHKGFELETKSNQFYETFLSPMYKSHLENLVRYEFTIKAHKHKKHLIEKGFNAQFKTLSDLLGSSPETLKNIAKSGLKCYLEKPKKSELNYNDLSPTDVVISYYIEQLIQLGFDIDKLLDFQKLIQVQQTRSRTKQKVQTLINNITSVDKNKKVKLENNKKANQFLTNIGI